MGYKVFGFEVGQSLAAMVSMMGVAVSRDSMGTVVEDLLSFDGKDYMGYKAVAFGDQ